MGNSSVKLVFPSHAMPYVIPENLISKIGNKIDELIKDMEGKTYVPGRQVKKLRLPKAGIELECPKPGDWVLIDIGNASIIHKTLAGSLVTGGGTYMVLPNHASGISKEALTEAIEVAKSSSRDDDDSDGLPGYSMASTRIK